jgi:hypothetical protein
MREEKRRADLPPTDGQGDFGEFTVLAPLHDLREQLERAGLGEGLVWVFPEKTLPGVTKAYGLTVIRADVPAPLLAHRPEPHR